MGLTPAFKVTADTQDITDKIADRLLELSLTDNIGSVSDTANIKLDDADHIFTLPNTGAKLDISLGYQETGVEKIGLYHVDEIELSGPPNTLGISAKAADMKAQLKAPKTRTWQKPGKSPARFPLVEILETIAAEHQLTPKMSPEFKSIDYEVINQTNESDLHLLDRLTKGLDAVVKVADDTLLLIKKDDSETSTGLYIPSVTLTPADISSWRVTIAERNVFHSVKATYQDKEKAQTITVTVGEGEPSFTLTEPFKDKETAIQAAESKRNASTRGKLKVDITLPGHPSYIAGKALILENFRKGVNGTWRIESATHTFNNQGYVTSLNGVIEEVAE